MDATMKALIQTSGATGYAVTVGVDSDSRAEAEVGTATVDD